MPAVERPSSTYAGMGSRASRCACPRCGSPIRRSTPRPTCALLAGVHEAGPSTRSARSWDVGLLLRRPLLPGAPPPRRAGRPRASGATRPRDGPCLISVGAPLARGRQPLQLRGHAARRAIRRRRTEGVPAELPRVLRAALVPARGRGTRRTPSSCSGSRVPFGTDLLITLPPRRRLRAPHRGLRGPLDAGPAQRPGGALRRHRAREPVGVERHGRQVGVPPGPGPHVGSEEPRRPALQRRRIRRVERRPRLGRPRARRRPRRAGGGDRALRARGRVGARRRRPAWRCRADRMRQTSFGQNAAQHGRAAATRGRRAGGRSARRGRLSRRCAVTSIRCRSCPPIPRQRDHRCREIFLIKATALAQRLRALPADGRRVVLGVSGGRDSTQALLVAVHAMDLLGLPPRRRRRRHDAGLRDVDAHVHQCVRAGPCARRDAARDRHPRAVAMPCSRPSATMTASRTSRSRTSRPGRGSWSSSRSRPRCAASISAPATSPSWRSASPPTAATTCRTTPSTPACRRRSSPS